MSGKRMVDGLNRGHWQPQEDLLLKKFIEANGVERWSTLPAKAGLKRGGKSCRLRWMNYLRPNVKRGHISEDEKDLIIRLHKLLGNRWSLIAARVPGRTDNDIKNFWNIHLSKKTNSLGVKDITNVKMTLKSPGKGKSQCHNLKLQIDSTPCSAQSKILQYLFKEESDKLNPSSDISTELKSLKKDCNSVSSSEENELQSTVFRSPSPSKSLVEEDSIGIVSDIQESSNGILRDHQETIEFLTTSSQYQFDVLSDSELFRFGCVPWLDSNDHEKFDCSYVFDSTRYFIDGQHNNLISQFDLRDMWY